MNIIELPFVAVGYVARFLLFVFYAIAFTYSWLTTIGVFVLLMAAIRYGSGSVIPVLFITGILAAGGFLFWKLDK